MNECGSAYGVERVPHAECGCPRVLRTRCDGLGPQLIVFELMQISLHEATGLDGLERHQDVGGTAVGSGGRGRETMTPRSLRRRDALISSRRLMAISHA